MDAEMRRRLFSCPEGLTRPDLPVTNPERKRKRSMGDLQMTIQDAYNDSADGKLSDASKAAIANAFNIAEKDVTRKFRNRRTFMEEKARKELIKNDVTSVESPAIDQIAGHLKTNSVRVKECLSKYYNKIVSAVQGKNSPSQEIETADPVMIMEETPVKVKEPPAPPTPLRDCTNCAII